MRIIYLHGFGSSASSRKAQYFRERFQECGVRIEIPNLDAGDFEHLSLTGQLCVIERQARGEAVSVMGSSMGGYLAALYAARHPEVERLILMAPAFAIPSRWADWLGDAKMAEWKQNGAIPVFHYADERERNLSYRIVEDAARYEDFPAAAQPTLIFHGTRDDVVPYRLSEQFAQGRPNVTLTKLDDTHDLNASVDVIWKATQKFCRLV